MRPALSAREIALGTLAVGPRVVASMRPALSAREIVLRLSAPNTAVTLLQ